MKIHSIVFSICFIIMLFAATLIVKTDAQALVQQKKYLISEKEKLQKSIRILQLEYAYLIRPERLKKFYPQFSYRLILPEKMGFIIVSEEAN